MQNFELAELIANGDVHGVRQLLLTQPNLANAIGYGKYVLLSAVLRCETEIVELLLNSGANIECSDDSGERPLHFAGRYGSPEIAELLCERGAEIESFDKSGFTPLWITCMGREPESIDVLRVLLEHGANPNVVCPQGFTPLVYVRDICDDEMEELLLQYGAVAQVENEELQQGPHSATETALWGAITEPYGIPLEELGPAAREALAPGGDWHSIRVTRNGLSFAMLERVPSFREGIQKAWAMLDQLAQTGDFQPPEAAQSEIPLEALGPKIQDAVGGEGDWQPIIITLNKQPFAMLTPSNC